MSHGHSKSVPGDGLGLVVPESMQDQLRPEATTDTGSSEEHCR